VEYLRIVVCVKLVPAITNVSFDPDTGTLIRDGVEAEVNPFDMYAIEEGIRLKERWGGSVLALSMGPPPAERALREALALGCDDAVLLSDRKFAGADTLATSYTLSRALRRTRAFDLIICGHKTTDGDTGQVGPGLAEWLGVPHVSYVRKIMQVTEKNVTIERTLENVTEELEVPLPCLITVTKEINEPRLPSFRRKMEARKMPIPVWTAEDLGEDDRYGLRGSPTRVVRVFHPPPRPGGEMLGGDPSTQAEALIRKLQGRHLL
jgi:electron transfer flavoprotein beta subunit